MTSTSRYAPAARARMLARVGLNLLPFSMIVTLVMTYPSDSLFCSTCIFRAIVGSVAASAWMVLESVIVLD